MPYHYQDRLTEHLELILKEGAKEPVDPREEDDCTMKVVITDKKTSGQIRMCIDATHINAGIEMTKYHIPTAGEVRHALEGATVFSELDICYGFNQTPLYPATS